MISLHDTPPIYLGAIPGTVVVGAVLVVLAVGLVVLLVVGIEVCESEPVMCGDEVHRSPALAAVVVELLRRAQQSPGEIRQGAVVAAPVRPAGIAVLAVPFGPSRGEVAELVAVRAGIPGLGHQLPDRTSVGVGTRGYGR